MSDKLKLLWHSNAPYAPTGYGAQTGLFASRLADRYDFAISAFYGLEGSVLRWNGIDVYPGLHGTYGNEAVAGHARSHFADDVKTGLIVSLMDVWVLKQQPWCTFNAAAWVPVDHEPTPPAVSQFFLDTGAVPIAMSRFGEEQLAEFEPLYCPHGVDTKAFTRCDKDEARKLTGLPKDAFVVGVVAANKGNPSRKSFPEILEAFAAIRERHDDAILFFHTERSGFFDGVNIPVLATSLGIPEDAIRFSDQYRLLFKPIPPDVMAYIYSAFDVILNPARGEGFGIPVLEAQACGVPGIVSDFSAMPEVCGAGWHVETTREWTPMMSWQCRPVVESIVAALEECYSLPDGVRKRLSEDARQHALAYDVDKVFDEYMVPALDEAWERCQSREPVELVAA